MLKALIGAGVLGLPLCFSKVNLAVAIPGLAGLALINGFGALRLIQIKLILFHSPPQVEGKLESANSQEIPKHPQTVADDFGLGPIGVIGAHLFGRPGIIAATVAVLGTQLGICLAYVKVVNVTLLNLPGLDNPQLVNTVTCIIFCLLCVIRRLRSLALLSIIALGTYTYAMFALVKWGLPLLVEGENVAFDDAWLPVKWDGLESLFGTGVFAFEGIVLAQYVFEDMKTGSSMDKFKKVLVISYTVSWLLFACVGCFGYLAYGTEVRNPFYLSFPQDAIDTDVVGIVLVMVLFVSFALQMFPIFSFFDAVFLKQRHPGDDIHSDDSDDELPRRTSKTKAAIDVLLRFGVVILVCILSAMTPKVSCVTDLVGSVFMSLMAFLLPGIFHIAACRGSLSSVGLALDCLLILIGVGAMCLGLKAAPTCFSRSS